MWLETQLIMNDSQLQCPVDKGFLRGSGYVATPEMVNFVAKMGDPPEPQKPTAPPNGWSVRLGYSQKYAIYVHENLGGYYIRPKNAQALHWRVGGKDIFAKWVYMPPNPNAKYLENPLNQALPGFKDRIKERVLNDYMEALY